MQPRRFKLKTYCFGKLLKDEMLRDRCEVVKDATKNTVALELRGLPTG
jgi:hypothetical protein